MLSSKNPFQGFIDPSILLPLPVLPVLRPLDFSHFVQEEVTALAVSNFNKSNATQKRLFEELLGDPQVLYQEVTEDPSRFEKGILELLLPLVSGQRDNSQLTAEERDSLDRATLDWALPRHQSTGGLPLPEPAREPAALQHLTQEPDLMDEALDLQQLDDGSFRPLPEAPKPTDKPPTFWWRG
jgi:hypothetical protein